MKLNKTINYTILFICGLSMIIPFLWMLTTSVKSQSEVNKGNIGFLPIEKYDYVEEDGNEYKVKSVKADKDSTFVHIFNMKDVIVKTYQKLPTSAIKKTTKVKFHVDNYQKAFTKVPFARYFLNTVIVSCCVVLGVLITGTLAAYAFARMRFKGREFIFYLFISMMMVPQPVYLIPSYVIMNYLGWLDTYNALIIPWIANVFTIFLLANSLKLSRRNYLMLLQ